ncbi:hypothetical protein ACE939_04565 [Aquimarina sp. W85]|uniref:hypothetical protein n=1 Tax=Aquimarina rhodophyticola TaxID=3342246 RepID=UPI00366E3929
MITAKEKENIVKILGLNYDKRITKHLAQIGLKNEHGKCHTKAYIGYIISGSCENPEIESLIFKFVYDQFFKNTAPTTTSINLSKESKKSNHNE